MSIPQLQHLWIRAHQRLLQGLALVLPFPRSKLLVGAGSSRQLATELRSRGWRHPLLVTDRTLMQLELPRPLQDALVAAGMSYALYDRVPENPSLTSVEAGLQHFRSQGCDSLIAVGGGSVIDCAKGIAARAGNPWLPLRRMEGLFRVLLPPRPLACIPTTAGSGSEASIAAVFTDPHANRKLAIADLKLIPRVVAIDPLPMLGLPPAVTAAGGMDALTHAVESYIGRGGTPFSRRKAIAALRRIAVWLPHAYRKGDDQEARLQMALAAHDAGQAFSRTNVGYAHAIAHGLGCHYGIPHGLANAMALPVVLRWSKPACIEQLASLARALELDGTDETAPSLAERFITWIEALNRQLDIPTTVSSLCSGDLPAISSGVLREAHPGYPVPRLLDQASCEALLRRLLPAAAIIETPNGQH